MKYLQIISDNPNGDLTNKPLVAVTDKSGNGDIIYIKGNDKKDSTNVYYKYGHTFSVKELNDSYTLYNMENTCDLGGMFGFDTGDSDSDDICFPIHLESEDIEEFSWMLSDDDISLLDKLGWNITKGTFVRMFITGIIFRRIKVEDLLEWDWSNGEYRPIPDTFPVKGIGGQVITADPNEEIIIDENDFYGFLKKCFGDKIYDERLEEIYNNNEE